MTDPLSERQELADELRSVVGQDPFLVSYALLYAVECLEIDCVKALVVAVNDAANNPEYKRLRRVAELEEERLLPSRLS